jgi:hypothetical protein
MSTAALIIAKDPLIINNALSPDSKKTVPIPRVKTVNAISAPILPAVTAAV